jgi:hypothetical protein
MCAEFKWLGIINTNETFKYVIYFRETQSVGNFVTKWENTSSGSITLFHKTSYFASVEWYYSRFDLMFVVMCC